MNSTTIDTQEIKKFTKMANEWWDPNGKFKPLHKFNPERIRYIKEIANQHFKDGLNNKNLLDIGCGGGLLSEPMARLGANVTGIDAGYANIEVAKIHAEKSELDINYINGSIEEYTGSKFDIILNMEIIEHVADVELFLEKCCNLLKKDGFMIIATLNRTLKSLAFAKIGAEYILRWLPIGTHEWNKFLKPSEINNIIEDNNCLTKDLVGMTLNPITSQWKRSKDLSINYIMYIVKN